MNSLIHNVKKYDLIQNIREFFKIQPFMPIIPWAQKFINFSSDISAQRSHIDFSLYPYQKDIIKEWQDLDHIKTVTVVMPEQMGKTNSFIIGLLWRMIYAPSQQIVAYPSDELAAATNLTKILPLMKHIPQLKSELIRPRSYRSDRYSFSNCISYFQGAGTRIVSKSCQVAVGDEVDTFPSLGKLDNVAELKKRTRSYDSSILFLISTPTEVNGRIWKSFLKSSMGYWHLRCVNCKQLTMRSCDVHNLQFESDYNQDLREYLVKEDTIRLVCPVCGYEHKEEQKAWMNINGGYIHKFPERMPENVGYQCGALASQLQSLSWKVIAQSALQSGKKGLLEEQTTFDNSIRGVPFKPREVVKDDFDKIKKHCWKQPERPTKDNIEMIFLVADTQDDRSVVTILGYSTTDSLYLLQAKEVQYLSLSDEERSVINKDRDIPIQTLQDLLYKEYLKTDEKGIKPLFGLIDRKGHRTNEIDYFASKHMNVLLYNGFKSQQISWRINEKNKRIISVASRLYQAKLIFNLYSQKNRKENYLFFYPEIQQDVIKQILSFQPNPTAKFGNAPENWQPKNDSQHDYFDCLKMAYFGVQFAIKTFKKDRFRLCKSQMLMKRFENNIKEEEKVQKIEQDRRISRSSWFKNSYY